MQHRKGVDVFTIERMSKNSIRLFVLIGKQTKSNGTACASQFHEKKIICDSLSVLIPFYYVLGLLRKTKT